MKITFAERYKECTIARVKALVDGKWCFGWLADQGVDVKRGTANIVTDQGVNLFCVPWFCITTLCVLEV
jgi:hypothetical protein